MTVLIILAILLVANLILGGWLIYQDTFKDPKFIAATDIKRCKSDSKLFLLRRKADSIIDQNRDVIELNRVLLDKRYTEMR